MISCRICVPVDVNLPIFKIFFCFHEENGTPSWTWFSSHLHYAPMVIIIFFISCVYLLCIRRCLPLIPIHSWDTRQEKTENWVTGLVKSRVSLKMACCSENSTPWSICEIKFILWAPLQATGGQWTLPMMLYMNMPPYVIHHTNWKIPSCRRVLPHHLCQWSHEVQCVYTTTPVWDKPASRGTWVWRSNILAHYSRSSPTWCSERCACES
jgi:hypothetical protein